MANRRSNSANTFETTLSQDVGATDVTFTVTSTSGAPSSPCYIVIDPDQNAKREIIWCDDTFDATHFRTSTVTNRHLAGSAAASGLTHSAGAKVVFVVVSQFLQDTHDRISQHTHSGGDDGANLPSTSVIGGGGGGGGGDATRVVGEVILSAAVGVPSGWLRCQGQAVSRTTYAALFAAVGTAYGVGDGSTTFNVPDLRNRVPLGAGASYSRGSTGGAEQSTITASHLPSHFHTFSATTGTPNGFHTHGLGKHSTTSSGHTHSGSSNLEFSQPPQPISASYSAETGGDDPDHTHSVSGSTSITGQLNPGLSVMQPYLGMDFLIYAGV